MAQQVIDVGTSASDGTGDPLRDAFTKINDNFTELYSTVENEGLTYGNLASNVAGITFNVTRYTENYSAVPVLKGTGQAVGNVYLIRGNVLGGTSPLNDALLTVTSLSNVTVGNVATVSATGVPVAPVLRVNGLTGNVDLTVNNIPGAASKAYVNAAIAANIANVTGTITDSLNANVAAANAVISNHSARITTLESNAASQATAINNLNSTKATIAYVDTSIDLALSSNAILADVAAVNANVAAANAAILLRANLSGANFSGAVAAANLSTTGNLFVGSKAVFGLDLYPNTNGNVVAGFFGNVASNFGISIQNKNTAGIGSVLLKGSNDGPGAENYVILGIAGDSYVDPIAPLAYPRDVFLYHVGGNVLIESENNSIKLNTNEQERLVVTDTGIVKLAAGTSLQFPDGTTQTTAFGGNADVTSINANIAAANVAISNLQSNASAQSLELNLLIANAASQAVAINTLNANASAQAVSLDLLNANIGSFQTFANSNASIQSTAIGLLNANVAAANVNISNLAANATTQALELNNLQSNAQAQQASIILLQSNATTQATQIDLLNANLTAANVNVINLTTNAASQATQINLLNANLIAANVNITSLTANAASQALDINNLYANVNFYLSNVASSNANIAAANSRIIVIDANLGSLSTNISSLQNNAAIQSTQIDLLNANLLAANASINNRANLGGAIFSGNVQAEYLIANANIKIGSTLEVGNANSIDYPGLAAVFVGNVDGYYQVVVQNTNSGPTASGDFVITADDGSDTNNYINIGINSSGWSGNFLVPAGDTNLPEFPHDGYFTTIGGNSAVRSSESIFLVANTSYVTLNKDSNFTLGNIDLQFKDGTVQTSAVQDVPALYANIGSLALFQSNIVGNASYNPNNAANYNGTITNIQQALDELAARLRALGG